MAGGHVRSPLFDAYARLRHVPDPAFAGQRENDADRPDDVPSDLEQARTALAVLARFTSTPDDCWFAVWEGCSSSLELPAGLPLLALPNRAYGLLHGALTDLADWEETVRTHVDAPRVRLAGRPELVLRQRRRPALDRDRRVRGRRPRIACGARDRRRARRAREGADLASDFPTARRR